MTKSGPLNWYFDFISPFAYMQSEQMEDLTKRPDFRPKPVLFAGILNHWGQLGPAEIPQKRIFTYQYCLWRAQRDGITLRTPTAHPFNPLPFLRLAIACNNEWQSIQTIFRYLWQKGSDPTAATGFHDLAHQLGLTPTAINQSSIKKSLHTNTDDAITSAVFGVPSFVIDDQVFWGFDATDMVRDYLKDAPVFKTPAYHRAGT